MKLIIDTDLCTACKLCSQVCIRDNIAVDDFAVEIGDNCLNVDTVWQYVRSVQLLLKALKTIKIKFRIMILKIFQLNMMICFNY